MATSALRLLLTSLPHKADTIASAIENGEMDVRGTLSSDLTLFLDFVYEAGNWHNATAETRVLDHQAQARLAETLCKHGANPWWIEEGRPSAFELAVLMDNWDLAALLGNHPGAPSGLAKTQPQSRANSHYFQRAPAAMVNVLLDLGFDPHVRTADGSTMLHHARDPKALAALLEAGVDPLLCNDKGRDAKAHWDQLRLSNEDRMAADEVFRKYLPTDCDELISTFGAQWLAVGPTISRQRLKDAGVDPETAHKDGVGLAERVMAEALRSGMRKPASAYGYQASSDPVSHRKWHKLVLSAMRLCNVNEQNKSPLAQQALDTLDLYFKVDKFLMKGQASSSKTPKKDIQAPKDPIEQLKQLAGCTRYIAPKHVICNGMSAIERLAHAGAIDNGSTVAGWLLKMHASTMTWAEWATRGDAGQTLFMQLACMATAEFDTSLNKPTSLWTPTSSIGYATMQPLRYIPDTLASEPHALGVMAIMAARTRHASIKTWLDQNMNLAGALCIQAGDPWIAHGSKLLTQSKDPNEQALGQRLGALSQAVQLDQNSAQVPTSRGRPRL